MRVQRIKKAATLILMIGFAAACVYGGEVVVTMKQPFKAGGKVFPAGQYRILADEESDHVNLRNLDRKTDDAIRFATRLSPREGQSGEVVFDKVENDLYLAEIYIIGMDGFYFQGAPGKHKHFVVKEDPLK
jgi:hypothetical protein